VQTECVWLTELLQWKLQYENMFEESSTCYLLNYIKVSVNYVDIDIFVNCSWVDTRWQ
jgi:hypothetical protein